MAQNPLSGVGLPLHRLLGARQVYFIGSIRADGAYHLCAATNVTSISIDPPLIAVALWPQWETTGNITRTNRFTVSLATVSQLPAVLTVGHRYTGIALPEGADKFAASGLTPLGTRPGYPAGVAESAATLACDVVRALDGLGDHVLLVARVTAAWVDDAAFSADLTLDLANLCPLLQVTGATFAMARPPQH